MQFSHSYVTELEALILDTLMPVYIRYYQDKKLSLPPINKELLTRVKQKPNIPALLRPYEKQS